MITLLGDQNYLALGDDGVKGAKGIREAKGTRGRERTKGI